MIFYKFTRFCSVFFSWSSHFYVSLFVFCLLFYYLGLGLYFVKYFIFTGFVWLIPVSTSLIWFLLFFLGVIIGQMFLKKLILMYQIFIFLFFKIVLFNIVIGLLSIALISLQSVSSEVTILLIVSSSFCNVLLFSQLNGSFVSLEFTHTEIVVSKFYSFRFYLSCFSSLFRCYKNVRRL